MLGTTDAFGLLEPRGNTPSTHILKPEHQDKDNYPHSVINEWFAMTLAKRVGLPAAGSGQVIVE